MSERIKITVNDIAREAGVSIATVSRAINGKGAEINFSTRQRILEIAKKLSYNLKGKKALATKNIGVVSQFLFATGTMASRASGFYNILFNYIEKWLNFYEYNPFFSTYYYEMKNNTKIINAIKDKMIGGVLVVGDVSTDFLGELENLKVPLVLVNHKVKGGYYNSVVADNFGGAYRLIKHLVKLKHKRIGFIGEDIKDFNFMERYRGYKDALKDSGISYDDKIILYEKYSMRLGYNAAKKILQMTSPPTAIFAANDFIGMNVVRAIKDLGLNIPEDISVAGFDAASENLGIEPILTSAKVYEEEMAKLAVERLLRISREVVPAIDIRVSTPIEYGESTAKLE